MGVTHGAGQTVYSDKFVDKNQWYDDIFFGDRGKDGWRLWAEITKYAQPLVEVEMERKAKFTDFIGFSIRGFIVNNKFREILESSNLPQNHRFLETTFIQKDKIIDGYWWFVYDMETGENTVDFTKCEYDLRYHKRKFGENFTVNIQTYQDYINVFYETGSALDVSKLIFNQNFDIFGMQFLGSKNYVSERLLKKMEAANITGYKVISPEMARQRAKKFNDIYCELIFQ